MSDPLLELSEGVAGLLDGGLGDQGARGLNEVGADGAVGFRDLRKTGGNVLFRDLRCLGLHHPLASRKREIAILMSVTNTEKVLLTNLQIYEGDMMAAPTDKEPASAEERDLWKERVSGSFSKAAH